MDELIVIDKLNPPKNYMRYDIINKKIISNIERVIRVSYHYKIFIYYLKNFLDLNRCAFYEGYSMSNGLGVEIHHSPITLYEYTYAVANKYLVNNGYFKIMDVARDVSKLHYQFKVGLVPLNPMAHKLVHEQVLNIHPDLVKGFYEEFYNEYKEYASDELHKIIERADFDRTHNDPTKFPNILRRSENKFDQKNIVLLNNIDISKMITDIKLER